MLPSTVLHECAFCLYVEQGNGEKTCLTQYTDCPALHCTAMIVQGSTVLPVPFSAACSWKYIHVRNVEKVHMSNLSLKIGIFILDHFQGLCSQMFLNCFLWSCSRWKNVTSAATACDSCLVDGLYCVLACFNCYAKKHLVKLPFCQL